MYSYEMEIMDVDHSLAKDGSDVEQILTLRIMLL